MISLFMLLLRGLITLIDLAIYSLAAGLYNTILLIADINIFSGDINGINLVQKISGNIYAFLGIFMLFRLAIAFVQYIMEPEKLSDSKIGGQKLVLRILVVILLIIGTPLIFKESINLQHILLKEDVVGKIVLGGGSTSDNSGDAMVYTIYKNGVAYVNPKFLTVDYESGEANYTFKNVNGTSRNAICSFLQLKGKVSGCSSENFESVADFLSAHVFDTKIGDDYVFEHRWLISLLVGGFLCYVLLLTCIDVGLRSVKLAFYQMIAPIPIISYLVPGQDGMLKKWSGEVIKTYLSVFISLAAFQFGFLLISYVCGNIGYIYGISDNVFVFLFLLLGILMFIKQMPEILKGIGLDVGGGFGLSLGKRLAAAAPAIGLGTGGIAGAITSYKARRARGGGIGRSLLSAAGGALSGAVTGLSSGINNKDGKSMFTNAMKSTHARANNIKTGQNFANRWIDKAKENLGFDKDNSQRKARMENAEKDALFKKGKALADAASGKNMSNKDYLYQKWAAGSSEAKEFHTISSQIDILKKNIGSANNTLMDLEKDYKSGTKKMVDGKEVPAVTAQDISDQKKLISDLDESLNGLKAKKDNYAKDGKHDEFVEEEKAMKYYEQISKVPPAENQSQTNTNTEN